MDCFAEPVIRRRFAPTGWLAMTEVAQRLCRAQQSSKLRGAVDRFLAHIRAA
jgi:uncharacterized alpha-E superfamily protein